MAEVRQDVIVADSSAWVELLRGTGSSAHLRLKAALENEEIAVTEMVIGEVMAGATSVDAADALRGILFGLPLLALGGLPGFLDAAALAARCRSAGATLRGGISDCLVAVPAIRAGAAILHADGDFDVLARHTALEVVALDD